MEKETLYKFFERKASPEEKEAIRLWLEASPEHEEELFREREFFDAMILSVPSHREKRKKAQRPFLRAALREALKFAALLALALSCGVYFYTSRLEKLGSALTTITVPAGQRVNLTLPDGTNVWLNARSELRYPAAFTGGKRNVSLDGEAYFEVARDAAKPFIVSTRQCDVEVLGTKFNVEAYADSDDFCTSLLEGSVRVTDKHNPAEQLILRPNHQAALTDGHLRAEPIADFDLFRWKEGLICFKNMNFRELMTRFEKCYGIHIIIETRRLDDYVCSGKFRISDGIDKALSILQRDAGYTFERNKDESVVYIR